MKTELRNTTNIIMFYRRPYFLLRGQIKLNNNLVYGFKQPLKTSSGDQDRCSFRCSGPEYYHDGYVI